MRDIRRLYYSELKTYAQQLARRANARMRSLEKAGLSGYSGAYIKRKGKRFSGFHRMTMPELRASVFEMEQFLESKTSTITGLRDTKKFFDKKLKREFTWAEYMAFWDMYDNFKEDYYLIYYYLESNRVQQEFAKVGKNGVTYEDVVEKLQRMKDYYTEKGTFEGFNDEG